MFKRILPSLLTAFAVLLDLTILPVFTVSEYMPVFSLITVLCLGLLLGRTKGIWYGLAAGLAIDILAGQPFGLETLLYTGVGYVGGVFGRTFTRHPLTPLIASAVGLSVYELVKYIYMVFSTFSFGAAALPKVLVHILIEVVCTEVLFFCLEAVIRPSYSRYAKR